MYDHGKSITCPKCGSARLYEAEFQQYRGWLRSSTPGGELSSLGTPARVLVCMCGEPVWSSGRFSLPKGERESFEGSLAGARRYLEQFEPEAVENRLREEFADRRDVDSLAQSVEQLGRIIAETTKGRPRQGRTKGPSQKRPAAAFKAAKVTGR